MKAVPSLEVSTFVNRTHAGSRLVLPTERSPKMITDTTQSASNRRPRRAAVSVGLLAAGFLAGISGPVSAAAAEDSNAVLADTDAGIMVAQRHQAASDHTPGTPTTRTADTPRGHAPTITLLARSAEFGAVDTGEPGDTVGDLVAFTDLLFDRADRPIGHAASACMRTSPRRGESQCTGTLVLDDKGTIALQGIITDGDGPPLKIAVVGGTGAYNGASGTMTVTTDPSDPDGLRLAVRLLR